jgi:hypothetical protein
MLNVRPPDHDCMPRLIKIETTRYSEVFRRILAEYASDIQIRIDGTRYQPADIPHLLKEWCTNAAISRTRDFQLLRDGTELFSFHDHPSELFANVSEQPFVDRLRAEHIVRYRIAEEYEPFRPFSWLRKIFSA